MGGALPLEVLPDTLAICRLPATAALPAWASAPAPFLTVSRTSEELSITVLQRLVPDDVRCERDYRALSDDSRVLFGEQFRGFTMYLWASGRADEAALLLERALRVDPGNLESRVNLADLLTHAERVDEAIAQYREVIDTDPTHPAPHYGLAQALELRGDVKGAIAALAKAYELDGEDGAP